MNLLIIVTTQIPAPVGAYNVHVHQSSSYKTRPLPIPAPVPVRARAPPARFKEVVIVPPGESTLVYAYIHTPVAHY